jgi:translation initiation factor IF-2
VEVDGETKTICFLDTPGHEAFSAMRARGAKMTDIAIIIVAADDSVRPQTREAVSHAQAAGVPLIVAINKIDKPGADIERVKQDLTELGLVAEEWGGTTSMVPVSAKKGTGVADLLQMVAWMAEEQQLVANPKKMAQGTVIEAYLDKKKGPVATLLVQTGTLKVGDCVSVGGSSGKVRVMTNDLGQTLTEAGPSFAIQMGGLDSVPDAGEEFMVHTNEAGARAAAEEYEFGHRAQRLSELGSGGSMVTLSSLASVDDEQEAMQRMNLIVKADTMGVVEAIKSALGALPQESVTLRYLLTGAGDMSISDVDLAAASSALLVGFNLEASDAVETHAKRLGVTIMTYKVIYDIVDDIKAAMEGRLKAVEERVALGKAEVKAVFGSGKKKVAGCVVTQGKVQKGAMVAVKRGKKIVHEGKLISLRRVKDDVNEVSEGTECGLGVEDFLEWSEGDVLECFLVVTKNRRLEEAKATQAVDMKALGF